MRKKPLLIAAGTVVVLLVAFGLYWFQPWKLFTSKTVNETPPAAATVIASGALITHEHATSGQAELVRLPDGSVQLILRDLATSDGPDLHVWLTDQPVLDGQAGWRVFDDGKWLELGRLKGTHGTQVYAVPAGTEVGQYISVSIWCQRFAVSFGAAPLAVT